MLLTFEQFQATREYTNELTKTFPDADWDSGYIYLKGGNQESYIELHPKTPPMIYFLFWENEIFEYNNLEDAEKSLYHFIECEDV